MVMSVFPYVIMVKFNHKQVKTVYHNLYVSDILCSCILIADLEVMFI
jgi:hypothetical protein